MTTNMMNNENQLNNIGNLNFEILPIAIRKKLGLDNFTQDNILEAAKQEYNTIISKENFIHQDHKIRKENYPTASSPNNKNKNRYNNAPATESTRIILQDRDVGDNYINANKISIPNLPQQFIICQAPIQNTFDDFFEMIWQENTQVVVCLSSSDKPHNNNDDSCISNSNMEENEKIQSGSLKGNSKYWPEFPIKVITTNNFTVTLVSQNSNNNNFHVRILTMYKASENKSKKIVHIQYSDWEDGGICRNNLDFLNLIKLTSNFQGRNNSPIVVHCSAGLGRSGLFVSVYSSIQILNNGIVSPINLNVSQIVSLVRSQRNGCVQNCLQYSYIYLILNLYVLNMRYYATKRSKVN